MPDNHSSADELVICVRPQGDLECLYRDDLELEKLGDLEVQRASHVEYDPRREAWVASPADGGEVIAVDPRRSVCLKREVEHFNRALIAGLRPFDGD